MLNQQINTFKEVNLRLDKGRQGANHYVGLPSKDLHKAMKYFLSISPALSALQLQLKGLNRRVFYTFRQNFPYITLTID